MRKHAQTQAKKLYDSVGARRVVFTTRQTPGTHNMCTARMSKDPRDGVCDAQRPHARHQEPLHLGRQRDDARQRRPTRR